MHTENMWDDLAVWFHDFVPLSVPIALVLLLVVIATAALIAIGDFWGGE
ncbi:MULTISPECIES: hypothetical protein [Serratia]|uniref:Uncharacterized protein n=1 Tax=Serratia quinivorans TaxID=137545 RepID=A0A379YF63_9GAMM|nr:MULTISPECIES: hypothetical protein [Serratia]CAI1715119.1 Uncharacterised protein [Serratia quinivorans]SUI43785.1 Uncharacterised protein [Serratia quinivorans]